MDLGKPTPKVTAHRRRYPWKMWFDSGQFTLRRGVDFDNTIMTYVMAQMIRNRASRLKKKVKINIQSEDTLEVTVQ